MLSAAAVNGNYLYWYILYSRVGPVILGPVILSPAESAMPWVYCCLPMMLNWYNKFAVFLTLN